MLLVSSAALPAAAQTQGVEARGAAEGAELALSEINTVEYPEIALFATVLRDGEPVTGLGPRDFAVSEERWRRSRS